ncbi:MAG: carbohydrate ABC transporter substrate-binding protein, partial [Clostridia bacterium]|nr:carbohydrate ABC transporter substrate-binding protein [Clostridia bacterium]
TDGILVDAPSWYVVNANGNVQEAIDYLNSLPLTEEGVDYMLNKAGMFVAFNNVESKSDLPLTKAVIDWFNAGKTYSWQQYKLPDGFGMGTLGQYYELLAQDVIDVDTFELMMKAAIADIAK